MPRDELLAVVAGREHDSAPPHSRMLPDLELDAVAQGSEAARLDDVPDRGSYFSTMVVR